MIAIMFAQFGRAGNKTLEVDKSSPDFFLVSVTADFEISIRLAVLQVMGSPQTSDGLDAALRRSPDRCSYNAILTEWLNMGPFVKPDPGWADIFHRIDTVTPPRREEGFSVASLVLGAALHTINLACLRLCPTMHEMVEGVGFEPT
ncbi:hypothetical protein AA12717_1846 [Gluconacetobacter sacchari DSM 12717]|nr:hypothetical protein AA12717_1846 [Gluconacetobacter sacchari DSM 12717]